MAEESDSVESGYADPWPAVRGDYRVGDAKSGVAVVTLASPIYPRGAAICGQCKTENLGVEKIVANVISNCNIRFLILCGMESKGHLPGNTILALHRNGIDDQGRIIGSRGAIPFIQNLPAGAIERFQKQVQLVDCIGLEDAQQIEELISRLSRDCLPYPEKPFQVIKRNIASRQVSFGQGDISFGARVVMDSSAWFVKVTPTNADAEKANAEG